MREGGRREQIKWIASKHIYKGKCEVGKREKRKQMEKETEKSKEKNNGGKKEGKEDRGGVRELTLK